MMNKMDPLLQQFMVQYKGLAPAAAIALTVPNPQTSKDKGKNKETQARTDTAALTPKQKSYVEAAKTSEPVFTLVENKRKSKPKAGPPFKPKITKINKEIIIESSKESLVIPSDIKLKINTLIQNSDCHLVDG